MFALLVLLTSNLISASELPCSEFEVYVKASEVRAHTKQDGTQISKSDRKEHCREIYLGTKKWIESFKNTSLVHWPYDEHFKQWSKKEKEIILKMISIWPDAFKNWEGISLYRANKSKFPNNPGASLPIANSIIVYDNFFTFSKAHTVLTHELAHIYILTLSPEKLDRILNASGWERDPSNRQKWSGKNQPLKEDSIDSPSEDLANHIEDFLHSPAMLKIARPNIFKLLENLMGPEFQLKDQK